MDIYCLTKKFYADNKSLLEIMQKPGRPYGIVIICYKSLRFAIPLRSHIKHKFCFLTGEETRLDYTKAVLITDSAYISGRPYRINHAEFIKLKVHSQFITQSFENYVLEYCAACKKNDQRILRRYEYSTLKNYLKELNII